MTAPAGTSTVAAAPDGGAAEQVRMLRRAAVDAGMTIDDFTGPSSRHEVVDGLRLHLLDWGTDGRPPVVFLHGTALTAHTWDLVALSLRADYHCVAVDLRGHGDSEWSPTLDYGVARHAQDVLRLLDSGVVPTPCHLVGMSIGGVVALTCAALAPEQVSSVAVLDIGPETFRLMRERMMRQRAEPDPGSAGSLASFLAAPAAPATLEEHVERAVAFNPRRDPELLRVSLLHNLRRTPDGRFVWKYDPRPYQLGNAATGHVEDPFDRLGPLKAPVLVLRGSESQFLSRAGAQELTDRLGNARWLEVPGASHSIQGDRPAELASILRTDLLTTA